MVIGIDFDNTLVDYSHAFYQVAREKKLIDADFPKNKQLIRDYLRNNNNENAWIEMQGIVYGSRMDEARLYPGVAECIAALQSVNHSVFVISHKTRFPFMGEPFDLHAAARTWTQKNLKVDQKNIFFELTKAEKINRIKTTQCAVFIDDLPEIFDDATFPSSVQKILFDDLNHHADYHLSGLSVCRSWREVMQCLMS